MGGFAVPFWGSCTPGFDLFEATTAALYLLEDLLDTGCPNKRDRIGVPRLNEIGDGVFQFLHAAKDPSADRLLAELGEPAFHEI